MYRPRSFLLAASLVSLCAQPLLLAQSTWQEPGAGDWFESGNWYGPVPDAATNAQVSNGGTALVNSGTAEVKLFTLGDAAASSGSAIIQGTLTSTTTINVGGSGTGSLTVGNGGTVSSETMNIGTYDGSTGAVSVSGTLITTNLNIGASGTGALNILSGGVVGTTNAQIGEYDEGGGVVNVSGYWSNAGLINVGVYGGAEMNIQAGGLVRSSGVQVSYASGYPGTLTIYGDEGNRGTLITDEIASTGTSGFVVFDGGVLQAAENVSELIDGFSEGGVSIAEGGAFINMDGYTGKISVAISGSGALTLIGEGSLELSGANSYQGGTIVESGTLQGKNSGFVQNTAYTVNGGELAMNGNALTMSSLSGTGGQIVTGTTALTISQTTSSTYAGNIVSTGTLIKQSTGTLTLSGSNSAVATQIQDGLLNIDGTLASATLVDENGTLGGSGTLTGELRVKGGLSPGNSPGELNTDSQIWESGGFYIFEINDAEGAAGNVTGWDLISINGGLAINENAEPAFVFTIYLTSLNGLSPGETANFDPATAYSWTLVTTTTDITGFSLSDVLLNVGAFENDYAGSFSLGLTNGGNDLSVIYTVPEPSTLALLAIGSGFAFVLLRRRKRAETV